MLLIVTATTKEMQSAFPAAPKVGQGEAVEYEYGGRKLLLAVSGVGLVNSAMAAGRLLGRPGIEGVINLGIGGAYDAQEFPIGCAAYIWQETWPEYGLLDEDGSVDPKAIGFSQGHVEGEPVWNRVKLNPVNDAEAMGLSINQKWERGAAISVSSVTGTPDRGGWLKTAYNSDIENMEGFALAYGTLQKGLPFLEVRTVSNLVGSRYAEDWDLKGALDQLEGVASHLFTGV